MSTLHTETAAVVPPAQMPLLTVREQLSFARDENICWLCGEPAVKLKTVSLRFAEPEGDNGITEPYVVPVCQLHD